MTLAEALEVMRLGYARGFADSHDHDREQWHAEHVAFDMAIAVLEPLAGLSDAEIDALISNAKGQVAHWCGDCEYERRIRAPYRALAASLTALRGQP